MSASSDETVEATAVPQQQLTEDELLDATMEALLNDPDLISKGWLTSQDGLRMLVVGRNAITVIGWAGYGLPTAMCVRGVFKVLASAWPDIERELVGVGNVLSAVVGLTAGAWLLLSGWAYLREKQHWDVLKEVPRPVPAAGQTATV